MSKHNDYFDLKNKVAVITGSAGRLGNRFAHTLCSAGSSVVLVDIDNKRNQILEKNLKKEFGDRATSLRIYGYMLIISFTINLSSLT